ncbi:putative serine/threonine-protein kinase iksA [Smittium mucronatum]|uniref:non-specific serine/threonine protein kinase n=1 Tax=Smittium mucronatum TaxID=133383 RepID=A0A1R0H6M8_9FUNG|nr:putative serine/threonine-protein kinase iksA [Smittium mucronatum]
MKYSHLFPNKSLSPDDLRLEDGLNYGVKGLSVSPMPNPHELVISRFKSPLPINHTSNSIVKKRKSRGLVKSFPNASQKELIKYVPKDAIIRKQKSNKVVVFKPKANKVPVRSIIPYRDHGRGSRFLKKDLKHTNDNLCCPTCHRPYNDGFFQNYYSENLKSEVSMDKNYFKYLANTLKSPASLELTYHNDKSEEPLFNTNTEEAECHSSASGTISTSSIVHDSKDKMNSSINDSQESSEQSLRLSESAFNHGYYKRFFHQGKKLGRGLRGSVYLCQHILDNIFLGEYAVKKVPVGNNHAWLQRMLREVKLLESLSHPNIIDYKHSWLELHQLTTFGPPVPCLFILMELANGGNLQEYMEISEGKSLNSTSGGHSSNFKNISLKSRREEIRKNHSYKTSQDDSSGNRLKHLSNYEIWSFFGDVCSGLNHLHNHGIIHRDLKPQNLLLSYERSKFIETSDKSSINKKFRTMPTLLLTDFGECEVVSGREDRLRTGATGTMEFMAPELIKTDENGEYLDDYSTKADMWSLGMLLYFMCFSSMPFNNIDDIDILRKDILSLNRVRYPKTSRQDLDPDFRLLINALLNQNKKSRPDASEILPQVLEKKKFWESRLQDSSRFQSFSATPTHFLSPSSSTVSISDGFNYELLGEDGNSHLDLPQKNGWNKGLGRKNISTVCEVSDGSDSLHGSEIEHESASFEIHYDNEDKIDSFKVPSNSSPRKKKKRNGGVVPNGSAKVKDLANEVFTHDDDSFISHKRSISANQGGDMMVVRHRNQNRFLDSQAFFHPENTEKRVLSLVKRPPGSGNETNIAEMKEIKINSKLEFNNFQSDLPKGNKVVADNALEDRIDRRKNLPLHVSIEGGSLPHIEKIGQDLVPHDFSDKRIHDSYKPVRYREYIRIISTLKYLIFAYKVNS